MIKILFIRSKNAFLPEIDAYVKFFNKTKEFRAFDSSQLAGEYNINDYDVIWEFKGFRGVKTKDRILIHEYASMSTGLFPKLKNNMKESINPKPNLRIFLNENVKKGFNFKDNIDYCYRDMGIDEKFIDIDNKEKEYEYVYVGAVCKERGIDILLENFREAGLGKICLVGNVEDRLYNAYKSNKNIVFTGKVPYAEVPQIASRAIYGVNYIPNKHPFNIQTSTKLLEYLALGLKVITTDYQWVREFENENNCNFYKLSNNMTFEKNKISKYNFVSNFNARNFLWDNIITKSKIKEKLMNIAI